MRIAALDASLAETAAYFGLTESLVGVPYDVDFPPELAALPRLTANPAERGGLPRSRAPRIQEMLAQTPVLVDSLIAANPDYIVTIPQDPEMKSTLKEDLATLLGHEVALHFYSPKTFENVLDTFEHLGRDLKVPDKGRALSHRAKAQLMDWSDNFYQRMKNKKVTFLTGVDPLRLAGMWIPDMIRSCSGTPQPGSSLDKHTPIKWEDVLSFNPDVLIVAPENGDLLESMKCFKKLEKLPRWEELHSVKRGEVVFAEGKGSFYHATPRLIDSMGVLVSAIAGLESGYITKRDSFFRLRYLELNRHKL